jgi:hypothetical protein
MFDALGELVALLVNAYALYEYVRVRIELRSDALFHGLDQLL